MPDATDDLFRRFGRAFNKANVEEIAACVTDDFEWHLNAGGAPAGRVLKGKDDLRAYFADKSKTHKEARYSEARIHRIVQALDEIAVIGVVHRGPVQRDGGHAAAVDLPQNRVVRAVTRHGGITRPSGSCP